MMRPSVNHSPSTIINLCLLLPTLLHPFAIHLDFMGYFLPINMAHFCPQELDFSLRRHLEDLGETQELWDGWSKPESQGAETVG